MIGGKFHTPEGFLLFSSSHRCSTNMGDWHIKAGGGQHVADKKEKKREESYSNAVTKFRFMCHLARDWHINIF